MPRVTSQQVKDFWRFMRRKYKFKVIDKDSADEMAIAGWALEAMGIQKKKDFLENYTTTICLGDLKRIYIPFEIGKGSQSQLVHQIVICVHECQHVIQAGNDAAFSLKYLASDASRTHYEVDAYRTNMEIYWWFYRKLLKPVTLANSLKGYGVGKADIRVAVKHLTIAGKVVERGGVISEASKVAIPWLQRNLKPARKRSVEILRTSTRG